MDNFRHDIDIIETIANTFGEQQQYLKTIEELGELTREISKDIAKDIFLSNDTLSEIADVTILLHQLLYLATKKDKDIYKKLDEHIDYKLHRTMQRIEAGYYK